MRIRISIRTKQRLAALKEHPRETYEAVLGRVLDDAEESHARLSPAMKKRIRQGRADIRAGRFLTTEQLLRELGLPPLRRRPEALK